MGSVRAGDAAIGAAEVERGGHAARDVGGATAKPTAAGGAPKAWEGLGAGDAAMGAAEVERFGHAARDGVGATATPTAAGAAAKAWEGMRSGTAATGAPSWRGLATPAPGVPPSSQAFAAAALGLAVLVRPRRFWPAWPAQPRNARINRPSAAPPVRSSPAFASRRSPATSARVPPAAGCRRCRALRSLRRSRRTTAPR